MTTSYERDRSDEGYTAGRIGLSAGANPYSPDDQLEEYESWTNGWILGNHDRTEEQDIGC